MASMTVTPSPGSQTAAQRQANYLKSLRSKGFERITVVVSASTAKLLRDLSRDHNELLTRVLELGVLVAKRELTAQAVSQG